MNSQRIFIVTLLLLAAGVPRAGAQIYGDGSDGNLTINSNTPGESPFGTLSGNVGAGNTVLTFTPGSGAVPGVGDEILLIQEYDTSLPGKYEFARLAAPPVVTSTIQITVQDPIVNNYDSLRCAGLLVHNYSTVNVQAAGVLNNTGGYLVFRANTSITVTGQISANNDGQSGGSPGTFRQGRSPLSLTSNPSTAENSGGGGAGEDEAIPPGGGGGGNATAGVTGQATTSMALPTIPGQGGSTYGNADLSGQLLSGAGGGTGGVGTVGSVKFGGAGGGIVYIAAPTITISGSITANGEDGEDGTGSVINTAGGAGGGAGGSIFLIADNFGGSGNVTALGGTGGAAGFGSTTTGFGGAGGGGRIHIIGNGGGTLNFQSGSFFLGVSGGNNFAGSTGAAPVWMLYQ